LPIASIVMSAFPTSMKSVGISRPYFIAPCTRSRIIAESSISLSGLPRYFSASMPTSARYSRMSIFFVGRPIE